MYTDKTYAFGGILWDACGQSLMGTDGPNHSEFRELLIEGAYGPAVRYNTGGATHLFAIDYLNVSYSDFLGGYSTPLIDITNAEVQGMRIMHPMCATGTQPVFETSQNPYYSGIELNANCTYTGANYYMLRNGSVDQYTNSQVVYTGTAARAFYQMSPPAAPQSAVVSSGGNVQVGTHVYQVTAVDFDGGETLLGQGTNATTTTGNQTITVTLPASFPVGAAGVNLYRDTTLVNANGCTGPQFTTPGGTYVDTYGFTCGNSQSGYGTAGTTVFSGAAVSAPKLRVAGEAFTAAPRGEQNIFLPGALTATWTASTWTPDKAITVTRMQVQAKTAPSGCTTNAVVRLTDGTSPVNLAVTAAAGDSGAIAQNYAAGTPLTVSVQTAAAGCGTAPADANVTLQYRMQ